MAKGYWIVHVDVSDPEAYEAYRAAIAVAFAKYGGKFLVRGGDSQQLEGALRSRSVIVEFGDYATAQACYQSAEYQTAKALRLAASEADLVIVEGIDSAL